MGKLSQKNRSVRFKTPLGDDVLPLIAVRGSEAVSEMFEFEVEVEVEPGVVLNFNELLGMSGTIQFDAAGDQPARLVNGIIAAADELPPDPRFQRYLLKLVPKCWLMNRNRRYRTFQKKTVLDIVQAIRDAYDPSFFSHFTIDWSKVKGAFSPYNYCVQYGESDFAFLSRLFEEEGLSYYFAFEEEKHTLTLTDANPTSNALPKLTYNGNARFLNKREVGVKYWRRRQQLDSSGSNLYDWSFQSSAAQLLSAHSEAGSIQDAYTNVNFDLSSSGPLGDIEQSAFNGRAAARFDAAGGDTGDPQANIQTLMNQQTQLANERVAAGAYRVEGRSNAPSLAAGSTFEFEVDGVSKGSFLVLRVQHSVRLADFHVDGEQAEAYENQFECLPASIVYRTPLKTLRPHVQGTQTATVVGLEENPESNGASPQDHIRTDLYGRVQVMFHWKDASTANWAKSCWLRVAQPWAGNGSGIVLTPRIGDEVLLDFLNGDPDQPVVIGSVYNAKNKSPSRLPEDRDQVVLRTQSNGGTAGASNELVLDDTNGSEYVRLYSQGDVIATSNDSSYDFAGTGGSYALSVNRSLPGWAKPPAPNSPDIAPPTQSSSPNAYMDFECPWTADIVGNYAVAVWNPQTPARSPLADNALPSKRTDADSTRSYSFVVDVLADTTAYRTPDDTAVLGYTVDEQILGNRNVAIQGSDNLTVSGGNVTQKITAADGDSNEDSGNYTITADNNVLISGKTAKFKYDNSWLSLVTGNKVTLQAGVKFDANTTATAISINKNDLSMIRLQATLGMQADMSVGFRASFRYLIDMTYRGLLGINIYSGSKMEFVGTELKLVGVRSKTATMNVETEGSKTEAGATKIHTSGFVQKLMAFHSVSASFDNKTAIMLIT